MLDLVDKGMGKQGEQGRAVLALFEANAGIQRTIIDMHPLGPRAWQALTPFQRMYLSKDVRPLSITAFWMRMTIGATQTAMGRLEDMRFIMFGSGHPWSEEEASRVYVYRRKHYEGGREGQLGEADCSEDDWRFTDRHRPGPPRPRNPLEYQSGGIYAACLLAALQLKTINRSCTYKDEEGETHPENVVDGQWTSVRHRMYQSCWELRQLRYGKIGSDLPTDRNSRMVYAQTIDELVKNLVSFVWKQAINANVDTMSSWKDLNLAHAWKLMSDETLRDRSWLAGAWQRLREYAFLPYTSPDSNLDDEVDRPDDGSEWLTQEAAYDDGLNGSTADDGEWVDDGGDEAGNDWDAAVEVVDRITGPDKASSAATTATSTGTRSG